ncbi:MAG: hypothetical protein ABI995_06410 [Acidobacteriota bacterium]
MMRFTKAVEIDKSDRIADDAPLHLSQACALDTKHDSGEVMRDRRYHMELGHRDLAISQLEPSVDRAPPHLRRQTAKWNSQSRSELRSLK